jgi:hypothetical protein
LTTADFKEFHFSSHRRSPTLTDTQNELKILVAAVVGIQHMLILEEVLMEEGH